MTNSIEQKIGNYLLNAEPILGMTLVPKKDTLAIRRICFLLKKRMLRITLPTGTRADYYSHKLHKLRVRNSYRAARDLTEACIHPAACGYTKEKTHYHAVRFIQQALRSGYLYTLRFDFQDFYDSIDLDQLEGKLQQVLPDNPNLRQFLIRLQKLPSFSSQDSQFYANENGVRQGLAPATLLANLYLAEFDTFCASISSWYQRFVDDGALCFQSEFEALEAQASIQLFLRRHYPTLRLHPIKTKVVSPDDLDFLGYTIKPGTLNWTLTAFASENIQNHFRAMLNRWDREPRLREVPRVRRFKKYYKSSLSSIQQQLSVVDDPDLKLRLWHTICQETAQEFSRLYPSMGSKRKAFEALGFDMGKSNAFLKGRYPITPVEPFTTTSLKDVLLQSLQTQNERR